MAALTKGIALLALISAVLALSDLDSPQSMSSLDDYGRQRVCAKQCYWAGWAASPDSYDTIGQALSCDLPANKGSPNWCFCRADQQSVAVSFLSTCVNSRCSKNTQDTDMATSLYLAYCTPKIAPAKPTPTISTTQPTTTAAATRAVQTVSATSDPVAVQTVYVTIGSSNRLTVNFSLALFLVLSNAAYYLVDLFDH